MKSLKFPLILLSLIFGFANGIVNAQNASDKSGLTRAQVKMEREEFVKSHEYDALTESWVLKPGFEAPGSMKTREQIKAERAEFFKNNRYDPVAEKWVSLKGAPKSALTREQVRAETTAFVRTHVWDSATESWVEKKK
jgi:hypothetical protein